MDESHDRKDNESLYILYKMTSRHANITEMNECSSACISKVNPMTAYFFYFNLLRKLSTFYWANLQNDKKDRFLAAQVDGDHICGLFDPVCAAATCSGWHLHDLETWGCFTKTKIGPLTGNFLVCEGQDGVFLFIKWLQDLKY